MITAETQRRRDAENERRTGVASETQTHRGGTGERRLGVFQSAEADIVAA